MNTDSLRNLNRWICWKEVKRDNGKKDKVPVSPLDGTSVIAVNNEMEYVDYETAQETADDYGLGIGIALGNGLSCIDLDDCVHEYGISTRALDIIDRFGSYTEFSPSGCGVHIFYYGKKPGNRCRMKMEDFEIEIYERDRFITVTENVINHLDRVVQCDEPVKTLYYEIFGDDIDTGNNQLGKVKDAKKALNYGLSHDPVFRRLWEGERDFEDESRNDQAIIGKLVYWLERDPEASYDLLLTSPYFETKSPKHQKKMKSRYKNYFLRTFEKINDVTSESCLEQRASVIVDNIGDTVDKDEVVKINDKKVSIVDFEQENHDLDIDVESGRDRWLGFTEKGNAYIIEVEFMEWLVETLGLMCINGVMYNEHGELSDDYMLHKIQNIIKPYISKGLARQSKTLFEAVRNEAYTTLPRPKINHIHTNSQTLEVTARKVKQLDPKFTINRLKVDHKEGAKCPQWLKFLEELIGKEYIPVLQEYMGYCLTPTNIAQTACFIVGNGGEGKSIVVQVLQKILGRNQLTGQIHKLSTNNFMLSNLENRLAFLDDDINLAALDDTSVFKQVVTNNGDMLVERKGKQAYNAQIYCKILACGNGSLKSRYDKSDGFYRRLMLIKCKPRPKDRVDDKMLHMKILRETDGIFMWMLEGLQRLMGNSWYFSKNAAVERNLTELKEEAENIRLFMQDKDYVSISQIDELSATSAEILDGYRTWCMDNGYHKMTDRQVMTFLGKHSDDYGLEKTNKIKRGQVLKRGYFHIHIKQGSLKQSGLTIYDGGKKVN